MNHSLLRLSVTEIEVMTEEEARAFCGGDSEIWTALLATCGLRPIKANRTRHQFLKSSVLVALKRLETSEALVAFRPVVSDAAAGAGVRWEAARGTGRKNDKLSHEDAEKEQR